MKNLFVVLEGLSAVGKTTLAQELVKCIPNAIYYKTPPKLYSGIRDLVDKTHTPKSRFFFYLAGLVYASEEIATLLKKHSVICDRYLITTLCYHKAIGFDGTNYVCDLVKPDYTFLVTCENKTRISRLTTRGLTFNDKKERKGNVEKLFLNELIAQNLITVDNTGELDQAIKQITQILDFTHEKIPVHS